MVIGKTDNFCVYSVALLFWQAERVFSALRVGVRRYGGCGVIGADLSFFFHKNVQKLVYVRKKV